MNKRLPISHPALDYAVDFVTVRHARLRNKELDRGASAVEWVVISMIVVGIVIAVGALLYNALDTKATAVQGCIDGANGSTTGKCS